VTTEECLASSRKWCVKRLNMCLPTYSCRDAKLNPFCGRGGGMKIPPSICSTAAFLAGRCGKQNFSHPWVAWILHYQRPYDSAQIHPLQLKNKFISPQNSSLQHQSSDLPWANFRNFLSLPALKSLFLVDQMSAYDFVIISFNDRNHHCWMLYFLLPLIISPESPANLAIQKH